MTQETEIKHFARWAAWNKLRAQKKQSTPEAIREFVKWYNNKFDTNPPHEEKQWFREAYETTKQVYATDRASNSEVRSILSEIKHHMGNLDDLQKAKQAIVNAIKNLTKTKQSIKRKDEQYDYGKKPFLQRADDCKAIGKAAYAVQKSLDDLIMDLPPTDEREVLEQAHKEARKKAERSFKDARLAEQYWQKKNKIT